MQRPLSPSSVDQQSFSYLPELVPNSDLRIASNTPDLSLVLNTFDLSSLDPLLDTSSNTFSTPPPAYSHSDKNPPDYQPPWGREVIFRHIRILQTQATEFYQEVEQRRTENIAIYNTAIDTQLRNHDDRYQSNIDHLDDLLELWD